MNFHDGSTATANVVVGCDGIKSRVRICLLGEKSPAARARFTGKYAYRGLIPMDKAVHLLGEELARNSQMYLGHHGHILTFPIEHGKTMNVVAFKTSKSGTWDDDRWVVPMNRENMESDFKSWGQAVRSILSLMEKPDVWALFDHPPADTYVRGRVCLLGDSAHASTPHQGAGAGMALEDAYILSTLLNLDNVDEIEPALKAYEQTRKERSQMLVTTSNAAGRLYDLEDIEAGTNAEKLKTNLNERYQWIWEHKIEDDMKRAEEELKKYRK